MFTCRLKSALSCIPIGEGAGVGVEEVSLVEHLHSKPRKTLKPLKALEEG